MFLVDLVEDVRHLVHRHDLEHVRHFVGRQALDQAVLRDGFQLLQDVGRALRVHRGENLHLRMIIHFVDDIRHLGRMQLVELGHAPGQLLSGLVYVDGLDVVPHNELAGNGKVKQTIDRPRQPFQAQLPQPTLPAGVHRHDGRTAVLDCDLHVVYEDGVFLVHVHDFFC